MFFFSTLEFILDSNDFSFWRTTRIYIAAKIQAFEAFFLGLNFWAFFWGEHLFAVEQVQNRMQPSFWWATRHAGEGHVCPGEEVLRSYASFRRKHATWHISYIYPVSLKVAR